MCYLLHPGAQSNSSRFRGDNDGEDGRQLVTIVNGNWQGI